jgi:hypothetical protein
MKYRSLTTSPHPIFRDFVSRDFGTCEYKGKLPLGLPGSEKTKCRIKSHYAKFGNPQVRFCILELCDTRGRSFMLLDYPNAEKLIHSLIMHLTKFGFHRSGFHNYWVQGNLSLNILVPEIPKINTCPCRSNLGFHKLKFRDVRQQGILHLDLLGAKTPKYKILNLHIYFGISPIKISRVRDLGLASTRNSPLDIPGVETPRSYNFSILLSFLDFSSRGFGSCEYRRTRT